MTQSNDPNDQNRNLDHQLKSLSRRLHSEAEPLARLKQSPLIANFQGDPDLAEKSEEIFHLLMHNKQ